MAEALEAEFGGEERRFLLLLGGIRKVEEKTGAACGAILHALARAVTIQRAYPNATLLEQSAVGFGELRVDYVREPILQGLVDGGMNPNDAGRLVRLWIDERGFQGIVENAWLAWMVLGLGWKRPDVGESEAVTQTATASPRDSISPTSTQPAAPSAGRPPRSTQPASGNSPQPSKAGTAPMAAKKNPSRRPSPSMNV